MAPLPARRRATYADVLAAPEHKVAEVIDGQLYLSPRPGAPHAAAHAALTYDLVGPFDRGRGGPGGWIILAEPELHLGDDIVVPDIAGWRRDRLPGVRDVAYFELAPDWLCEVLSPSTEKVDRGRKLGVYARAAVEHIWFLNTRTRMLEVMRRQDVDWLNVGRYQDDAKVRAEPFDAVELDLAGVWANIVFEEAP